MFAWANMQKLGNTRNNVVHERLIWLSIYDSVPWPLVPKWNVNQGYVDRGILKPSSSKGLLGQLYRIKTKHCQPPMPLCLETPALL